MLAKYCDERDVRLAKQLTKYDDKYVWSSFPMTLSALDSFEERNPDTTVNVYGSDDLGDIHPLRISPKQAVDHTNLLYYNNHYTYIKNLKNLLSDERKYKFVCEKCLILFSIKKNYNTHAYICPGYSSSKLTVAEKSLPKEIIKKRALVTPGSMSSEESFRQAVLLGKAGKIVDLSEYGGLVTINEVARFNRQNPESALNVYTINESNKLYPLYISKNASEKAQAIHLFYYDQTKSYYYIKDLRRLVRSQKTKNRRRVYICPRCSSHFPHEWNLLTHKPLCSQNPVARVYLPAPGANILTFTKFKYKIKQPITMFFDFETTLKPIDEHPNSSTHLYARHEPNSFCLHVVNEYEPATMPRVHCGKNAVETFFKYLFEEVEKAMGYMARYTPYDPDMASEFDRGKCHICELPVTATQTPCVNHWHQVEGGTIRGYAHVACNLAYQQPDYITVYSHNGSKYDQKLMLKHMIQVKGAISVIARTDDEFITIILSVIPTVFPVLKLNLSTRTK
nr:PREDICTED: uncharacterized protein LOC109040241 isoform X1 [Bemisia tabaci]XP_018911628.1 PREDICTED: uncharacterized protein LOC109040241 isoform X1 [Bemisia tabaci]XP_018911629.1 PREDICTED: uncharacterized protein LOC109040241 isoform X1 [Bemisia tabaci]XP_018911630.1 PREDICTED: uncharacterized protein LOC109040241 isoform X1 [Bemisia tabaci]XP_018911631.1 PREDICTED: uncharacterized protein LOC109040241 isoform X1 [Bemisia tabaci]XP_018911632.1 PREDICTED: uncharacterized protein LOC1090402